MSRRLTPTEVLRALGRHSATTREQQRATESRASFAATVAGTAQAAFPGDPRHQPMAQAIAVVRAATSSAELAGCHAVAKRVLAEAGVATSSNLTRLLEATQAHGAALGEAAVAAAIAEQNNPSAEAGTTEEQ